MSEQASLGAESFRTFVCPACAGHELPDEVGLHRCECGAEIDVYTTAKDDDDA